MQMHDALGGSTTTRDHVCVFSSFQPRPQACDRIDPLDQATTPRSLPSHSAITLQRPTAQAIRLLVDLGEDLRVLEKVELLYISAATSCHAW